VGNRHDRVERALIPVGRTGLALAALALAVQGAAAGAPADCAVDRITLLTEDGPRAFRIEIADDPAEQSRGLMFRPQMAPEAGMLFVFEPPKQAQFWMRNTMIPLDMVFIDATGRVESIAVRRDTYSQRVSSSEGEVRAVLEINAGLSEALGIGPGTQAVHPAFAEAPEGARCPTE